MKRHINSFECLVSLYKQTSHWVSSPAVASFNSMDTLETTDKISLQSILNAQLFTLMNIIQNIT